MMIRLCLAFALCSLCAITQAYKCPGKKCDISYLTSADCLSYVEQDVLSPMQPTSAPKKPVLVGGDADEVCSTSKRKLTVSVDDSKTDLQTVTATGAIATSVGAELKTGIKDVLEIKGSGGVTSTDTNSYAYQHSYTFLVKKASELEIGGKVYPVKGYLNAFIMRKVGTFNRTAYVSAGWENANGCFTATCGQTTATGHGESWSQVVHFRPREVPCLPCPTGPTTPAN